MTPALIEGVTTCRLSNSAPIEPSVRLCEGQGDFTRIVEITEVIDSC